MLTKLSGLRRLAASAVALAALAGCSENAGPGETELSIRLTDAAGDIRAATVTISEIYLQGEGGRVVLLDEPVTTDLVTLANDTRDLVDGAIVPEGRYSELRFVITGGFVEVENEDGSTSIYSSSADYEGLPGGAVVAGELQMPSLGASGLKVKFGGQDALDVEGEQQILLVDFDVAQSFGQAAGNSARWVMNPVIKGADLTVSGGLTAELILGQNVTLPSIASDQQTLEDISAVLTNEDGSDETLALTGSGNTASAEFRFLLPGTYTLRFATPVGMTIVTDPATPRTVTVDEGRNVTVTTTVTSATSP